MMRSVSLLLVGLLTIAATGGADSGHEPALIDRALDRMYNCDFAGANVLLDEQILSEPENPLGYAMRAAAVLYQEFDRLGVLETQFFADDDKVTDKRKFKKDDAMRARLFAATGEARERARTRLADDPSDADAMFAMCMTAGLETDYTTLIEKKYVRAYKLSKESQIYARHLLALDPPVVDAYLTLGSVEYFVAKMNWFMRMFVRFDQIEGSTQKSIDDLERVVSGGRYYAPMAKVLLALVYLREGDRERSLALLKELQRAYPGNPLFSNEVARVETLIAGTGPVGP
jgi:hypothetical protein